MKRNSILKNGLFIIIAVVGIMSSQMVMAQNLIDDPSFEFGSPNPFWTESSTNFGTPLCTVGFCGNGGGTSLPHTGDWWAWFGGIGAYEQGELTQSVVIPAGTASLSFWLFIGTSSGNGFDYLSVKIDGNTLFTAYEYTLGYETYAQVVLDVSAFADGGSHTVTFLSEILGPVVTNFSVDDVELLSEPAEIPFRTWSILIAIGLISALAFLRFSKIHSA